MAFPPPDPPHLWHERIAQLAADLGMSSETAGKDIMTFAVQVTPMKNELDQVVPLVNAIATAARVLESRVDVPGELLSIFADLYHTCTGRVEDSTREAVDLK